MSPQKGLIRKLSKFTILLLNSTGWYITNSSMEQEVLWGKNKGCDFLKKSCNDTSKKYKEFCSEQSCGIDYNTLDLCFKQSTFENYCPIKTPVSINDLRIECTNPILGADGLKFGYNSFCLISSIFKPFENMNYFPNCFQGYCTKNSTNEKWILNFYINKTLFTFEEGSELIQRERILNIKIKNSSVLIHLPDIKDICQTLETRCENDCYNFGYCTKEKKCFYTNAQNFLGNCTPGKYSTTFHHQGDKHCDNCNDENHAKLGRSDGSGLCVCKKKQNIKNCHPCPQGRFFSVEKNYCDLCTSNCSLCTSAKECLTCNQDYYKKENSCVKCNKIGESKKGTNNGNGICIDCLVNCINCDNSQECLKCQQNYYLKNNTKECSLCNESSILKQGKNDGTGKCVECPENCLKCKSKDFCETCKKGLFILQLNETHSICNACDQNGYYKNLTDLKCKKCLKSNKIIEFWI